MENREEKEGVMKEGQVQKEGDYMIFRELQCACIRGTCSPTSSQFYPRKRDSEKSEDTRAMRK